MAVSGPVEGGKEFEFLFTPHSFMYKCPETYGCVHSKASKCVPWLPPYRTLIVHGLGYARFRIEVVTGG